MNNFIYHNPTQILFGKGMIASITPLVAGYKKVLITYGGGSIKKNGVYDQVVTALKGINFIEFGGIEPNPNYKTLDKAIEICKKEGVDFILAVGGGSVVDGSKYISAGSCIEGAGWENIIIKQLEVKKALPLGAVLTLPATGSESNAGAVISNYETNEKRAFKSPLVIPTFAVLDPETTYTLPAKQLTNGIADAFVHIMEQYLTYNIGGDEVQERQSEALLLAMIDVAPRVMKNGNDYDARSSYMWCANQALNYLCSVGVPQDWATHMIGHELTANYGLDHAQSLMIVLPAIMSYKKDVKRAKLIKYAKRVWGCSGSDDELVSLAISKTKDFFLSIDGKIILADYGIDPVEAGRLVRATYEKRGFNLGERQDITPVDIENILKKC